MKKEKIIWDLKREKEKKIKAWAIVIGNDSENAYLLWVRNIKTKKQLKELYPKNKIIRVEIQ